MRFKLVHVILILIVVLGITLRFYKLSTNIIFGRDQSEDVYKLVSIYDTIKKGSLDELQLIGESGTYIVDGEVGSYGVYPVYTGVFFLYFLLPVAIATSFNPVGVVGLITVINLMSIFVIFLLGKELFDEKTGLIAAFIFSTSYFMNVYSRAIWTPSLVPSFVVFALYLLVVIKNKTKVVLWPVFLFLASGVSQIHDSGYYYMFLLLITALFLKPKVPKTIGGKIVSIFAFLIPLIPTIIHEIKTGFKLLPSLTHAFLFQLQISESTNFTTIVFGIVQKFWQFWVSVDPIYHHAYYGEPYNLWNAPFHWSFVVVGVASLVSVFIFRRKTPVPTSNVIFLTFLLTFLPIPYFASIYYADSYPRIMPLFGTVFSVLGAMPILILFISSFLGGLMRKGKILATFVVMFTALLGVVNIVVIKDSIWNNGERKYNYKDKTNVAEFIKHDVGNKKYDFSFLDDGGEGEEFFYLLSYSGAKYPVSYNGKSTLTTYFKEYEFSEGASQVSYLILGKENWATTVLDNSWKLGLQTGRYRVFSRLY